MSEEDIIEEAIQNVANLLRTTPFTFEFRVKKKPQGIKIIYEITQSHMDEVLRSAEILNE